MLRIVHCVSYLLLLLRSEAFLSPRGPTPGRNVVTRRGAVRQATFGMGCFWKPSEELLKVPGVIDTVVGYTGNPLDSATAPSYQSVCMSGRWVEGVRVLYDDDAVSYEALLDAFFEAQEPKYGSRQYASIIFPHDDAQGDAAADWIARNAARVRRDGVTVGMTRIEERSPFFRAENYHQRYWQKTRPRLASMVGLLAVSSGGLDRMVPIDAQEPVHILANGLVLAGSLFVAAERLIDRRTVRLDA